MPYVSKNCGVKWTYSQGNKLRLTIGNYTNLSGVTDRSGTVYVDMTEIFRNKAFNDFISML